MTDFPFGDHALILHEAGQAVIPLAAGDDDAQGDRAGKKPLVANWRQWNFRPSARSVSEWAAQFPSANVGYVPGLSRPPIILVDDDGGADDAIRELFGETPGRVATRRGSHHLYRDDGEALPKIADLKKFGINADLKHGISIAVSPPSVHRSGAVYAWADCDPAVLKDIPPFPTDRLKRLIASQDTLSQTERKAIAGYRSGSRKLALNDQLCRQVSFCDTLDDLLDCAFTWNEQQPQAGIEKLDDEQVMQTAQAVWNDSEAGKIERWHRRPAKIRTDKTEFERLTAFGKNGSLACVLLMKLRAEHGGRTARSRTFAISDRAMAEAQTIPGWTRYDYVKARDVLLEARFLEVAHGRKSTANGWLPIQYRLTEPMATR